MIRVHGFARWLMLLCSPLVAASCSSNTVKDTLGLNKRAPDEFQVVRRAPLIVPPDLRLRPPQPGSEGPQIGTPSAGAYTALTGQAVPPTTQTSSLAQQDLLAATPGPADPNIRQVIAQEDTQLAVLDSDTFLFILSWQKGAFQKEMQQREILNPVAETQRLQGGSVVQTERTASTPINQ